MSASFTCPRCGATSHHPQDVEEGYCGVCRDWTRGETVPIGSGVVTQAQRDWGPEIHPDHYAYEGCCDLPARAHPLTPDEARERHEWDGTEPGLRQRLELREAAYARLEALGAHRILMASQRRMVNDVRRALGEPVMEGEELNWKGQPDE